MGALKIRMFDGDQIDTVWKPNVLVRHLAQRNHQEASVASRKTSEAKKRVTLQSLGPIKNYNFPWVSNRHSVDLR